MNGANLIAVERSRQVSAEGWTLDHDDHHTDRELLLAAGAYLARAIREDPDAGPAERQVAAEIDDACGWPWDESMGAGDPERDLIRAGALIAAEIDRLRRKAA